MTGNKIVEQIYSEEGVWVSHKMFLSHLMTTTKASKLNPYFDVTSKSCTSACTPPKLTRKNRQKEEEWASSLFQTIKTIRSYFLNNNFEKDFLGFWCSERPVPCLVRGAIGSFKSWLDALHCFPNLIKLDQVDHWNVSGVIWFHHGLNWVYTVTILLFS